MWTLYESHPKGSRQDWDKLEERQKVRTETPFTSLNSCSAPAHYHAAFTSTQSTLQAALLTHLTQTLAAVHKLTPPASLVAHLQFSAPTRSAWAESPTMTKSDLAELIFTKLGLRSPPTAAMSTTSTAENGTASASATTTNDHDQPGTDISTEPARGRARLRAAGGAETGSAIPNSADVASDTDTDTAPDPVSDAKASPIPVPVPVQFKTTKNEGRGTSADSGVAGMSLSPETDKTLAVSSGGGEGQGTLAANLSSAVGSPPECDGGARAVGGPGMDGLGVPMRARRTSVAEKNEARIRALLEAVPDEREEPCLCEWFEKNFMAVMV